MGWFDWYQTSEPLQCPVCRTPLSEWQGKDGPCGLFVWEQGRAAPVDQKIEKDIAIEIAQRETLRLPEEFLIFSYNCSCPFPSLAHCSSEAGIWTTTALVTSEDVSRFEHETRDQFEARKQWLEGNTPGEELAHRAIIAKRLWVESVFK